jgi:glycosyltransferase involved in cell wall biosynthesis
MIHYVSQLANNLLKNNDISLIAPECLENSSYFKKGIRIFYVPIPPKNRLSLGWFKINSITRVVREIQPDIIHITALHPILALVLPILRKYPIIITLHDIKPHPGDAIFLYSQFESLATHAIIRIANKIIVHGKKLKEELIEKGICKEKIEVISHGDYSFFLKYAKENVNEENKILFFGRIREYKGLKYLIEAKPLIVGGNSTKIIIAGQGDLSKYEKLLDIENFEVINKYIPDEEVAELFQRSKIVVLPYIEASQSGVIAISYAFKKPVVATRVGAIGELVEDGKTGFLVPPKDPKALAEALNKLLRDDKLRKQMGENGYMKMKGELSWDEISAKTIELYQRLLNNKIFGRMYKIRTFI